MKSINAIPATIYSIFRDSYVSIKNLQGVESGRLGEFGYIGNVADGAAAIANKVGNVNTLATTGAKIISFYSDNTVTEKAWVTKDGRGSFNDGVDTVSGILYYNTIQGMRLTDTGVGLGLYAATHTLTGCACVGWRSGQENSGTYVTALGYSAAYQNVGGYSVLIGNNCARGNSGAYATIIGSDAGYSNKGANIVGLGCFSAYRNFKNNILRIANTKTDLALVYGEFDTPKLRIHGDQEIVNPATLGTECLSEPDFATHAKWDVTGLADDSGGNCIFTGVGTLTQTQTNLATPLLGNRWYKLVYTISAPTGSPAATITTGIADVATSIRVAEAGTWDCLIYTKAVPTDFVISVTAGTFTIDDISFKEIQGGDLKVRKDCFVYNSLIVNDGGEDKDSRIEGDTDANLITTDASTNSVSIGVAVGSHVGKFHIDQNEAAGAKPVITLDQGDVSEEFLRLIGESTTDNSQSLVDAADLETPGAIVGWFKIYVQDDQSSNPITDGVYYVPFYSTPTHVA